MATIPHRATTPRAVQTKQTESTWLPESPGPSFEDATIFLFSALSYKAAAGETGDISNDSFQSDRTSTSTSLRSWIDNSLCFELSPLGQSALPDRDAMFVRTRNATATRRVREANHMHLRAEESERELKPFPHTTYACAHRASTPNTVLPLFLAQEKHVPPPLFFLNKARTLAFIKI
jgi:hypothetical protein